MMANMVREAVRQQAIDKLPAGLEVFLRGWLDTKTKCGGLLRPQALNPFMTFKVA